VGVAVPPWETAFIREVELIPPVGDIRGIVFLEGGPPHDNVTVSVDGTSISAQTLTDGSFLLEEVQEGEVSITAYKAGFETAHVSNITVLPGQTVILEDPMLINKPPEPPTGVTAAQASGSSVNVAWTASVSSDVAGYNVYYGTSSDQINQKVNTELVTALEFEVTALDKGVTYYFAVEAVDDDGLISLLSQYDSIEIVPGVPPPPAPSEIWEGEYPFFYPDDICFSRDGERAYVTNPGSDVVSLVDVATAIVLGTIIVGDHPLGLAINPVRDEVYCVNKNSNTITVIDSTENDPGQAVVRTLSTADMPVRCLASPDGKYLFVSCIGVGADSITVIDLDTAGEISESPISVGIDPQGMAIANNKLYVANSGENHVGVIDIDPASSTRWQKMSYNIPVGESPFDLASRPDGNFVYVANQGSDTVSVIDTSTDLVVESLNVGDYPYRMATAGDILYVTNWLDDNVSIINMDTNQVLASTFGVGSFPQGIGVTSDGETIYVVNNGSESVSIRTY
jgi:YVTN family beta-propeller protein